MKTSNNLSPLQKKQIKRRELAEKLKKSSKFSKKYTPLTIKDLSKKVTDGIISCLKKGIIPWKSGCNNLVAFAKNYDGNIYRGINRWILNAQMMLNNYEANTWITFNRCRKEGGNVIKGSKSTTIVFWNFKYIPDSDCTNCGGDFKVAKKIQCDCGRKIPYLRSFNVFNICQTSLFDAEKHVPKPSTETVETNTALAEQLIHDWDGQVDIKYGYDNMACPYYSPISDFINIPLGEGVEWVNEETLHKTTFHEMMHSTGHKSRLNRFDKAVMDGVDAGKLHNRGQYSAEELVAEMGSQILSDACGFKTEQLENTSAYIGSWIKCLKNNENWVIWASGRAEKGVDMILDNSMEGGK